ncbi:MAG: DUF3999 domain-containing protein [bacterium]|nr:DUF3999 domain-containing protein [bacterium]
MTVRRLPLLLRFFLVAAIGASGGIATASPAAASAASEDRAVDLGWAWRNWAYSRPIAIGAEALEQRLVRVPVSDEVFAHASIDLSDLRVIDDSGKETGYVLYSGFPTGSLAWRDTDLIDTGYVPGSYTQAVVDTGGNDAVHSVVKVELSDRKEDFFGWAEISASSDYEAWRTLRAKAPVYHFRETGEGQAMRVGYPPTRDRWLRLRLLRDDGAVPIASIRVANKHLESEAELEDAGLELALREDSPVDESWWELASERRTAPISAVRVETLRNEFHRPVKVGASDDGDTWRDVGRGLVYRFLNQETGAERESLQVEFSGSSARFWRVAILDGNDAPIDDLRITLLRPVQSVVFRPEARRAFRLLYGHSRAESPRYELAQLLDSGQLAAAPLGALGAEEPNPDFVSSEPFSERHPVLIWAALALAVLVLGALAVKSFRSGSDPFSE